MFRFTLISFLLLAVVGSAVEPEWAIAVEKSAIPEDVAAPLRDRLNSGAVRIRRNGKAHADLWVRREAPNPKSARFADQPLGSFIGVIRLYSPWVDFRTQEVPAGTYTLRTAMQPPSRDHVGTSPVQTFAVLVRVEWDRTIDPLPVRGLTALSGKAIESNHPVVMPLWPDDRPDPQPRLYQPVKGATAVGVRIATERSMDWTLGLTTGGTWLDLPSPK